MDSRLGEQSRVVIICPTNAPRACGRIVCIAGLKVVKGFDHRHLGCVGGVGIAGCGAVVLSCFVGRPGCKLDRVS